MSVLLFWLFLFTPFLPLDRKLAAIEESNLRPGSHVITTSREWTQWAQREAPEGVHQVKLLFGAGRVIASANINFLQMQTASGQAPGWLLSSLLEGERSVTVQARVQSNGGKARVDVESLTISGKTVGGKALTFLIQQYVRFQYPDAKVSEWFPLGYRMDHFEIAPNIAVVVIGQ